MGFLTHKYNLEIWSSEFTFRIALPRQSLSLSDYLPMLTFNHSNEQTNSRLVKNKYQKMVNNIIFCN